MDIPLDNMAWRAKGSLVAGWNILSCNDSTIMEPVVNLPADTLCRIDKYSLFVHMPILQSYEPSISSKVN